MAGGPSTHTTLMEAVRFFSDPQVCVEHAAKLRWPDGKPVCPKCGGKEHYYLATQFRWKCKACYKQFSVKSGSIFEDSPIPLDKWLVAIWLIGNCKNGISSYELARDLKVTQKSAWFMLHRIRLAMQTGTFGKLGGEVEVDETFIGGKARNMHKAERERKIRGRGPEGKAIVAAVLERGGKVRACVVNKRRKKQLHSLVRENVETGANLYSDALRSYDGLGERLHASGN